MTNSEQKTNPIEETLEVAGESVEAIKPNEHIEKDLRPETTGESNDIQAEVTQSSKTQVSESPARTAASWVDDLKRYHNDMNGLLAAKENLKLVALDKSVKPSFRHQWSLEANDVMRITAILRRRLETVPKSTIEQNDDNKTA